MITISNYKEKAAQVDFTRHQAKALQEGHAYVLEYGDLYEDDADIKEAIDLYLEKLNTALAEKPEYPKPEVFKPTEKQAKEAVKEVSKHVSKGKKVKSKDHPKVEKKGTAPAKGKQFKKEERAAVKKNAEQYIKDIEKQGKSMTESQVIQAGLKFEKEYRSGFSQAVDENSDSKQRLSPTPENLIRWMRHPGQFDLIGVDTFKRTDPTKDYKKEISIQKFWNNIYNIKIKQ